MRSEPRAFCFASVSMRSSSMSEVTGTGLSSRCFVPLDWLGFALAHGISYSSSSRRHRALCLDLCRVMHNGAAGRKSIVWNCCLFCTCASKRESLFLLRLFFNHALNHFSGDELRTGVWWRTRSSTVSVLAQ